ncbi:TPA: ead/Ea22-like family protein [Salmonella enterica subsp. houtenae serovar Rough:z4,z23:-]
MTALNKQALRERYSSQPVPKCHICGAEMTIQRAGAGSLVYGCTGRVDSDGEGCVFAEGRDFADNHYALSRVTVANDSDPDVLAMLDELEGAEKRIAELEARAISIPEVRITVAESKRKNLTWRELGAYNEGADVAKEAILAAIRAAGIGVKGK